MHLCLRTAAVFGLLAVATSDLRGADPERPRVAGITTVYHTNAHADVILGRLIQTHTLDGKGRPSTIELASLYTDQVPQSDLSRGLSREYGFPIFDSVAGALTLGGDDLAVDGVMLVAEHGDYAKSDTGQTIYPKRRLFEEIVRVFERSGRVVPVFCDKHLADNWEDAKWIYDTAQRMQIPMMAGSSLPGLWRYPPADVRRDAPLKEIVVVSYHSLDAYGFHAMEIAQCLAERRRGGETGIASVRCITGKDVWKAGQEGVFDRGLLDECLSRLKARPIPEGKTVEELTPEPVLFVVNYRDGLRANVLTLNGAVAEWAAAWRYADEDGETQSTLFWTQEARPYHHFSFLVQGVEKMMQTGRPTWPVERTLLTSGALDALLISKRDAGAIVETPHLDVTYRMAWNWTQPPAPPK